MPALKIRDKADCQFDEISLGEVMLRLDPGDSRIRTAREFKAWEGGGEYNVARGLRKCFGMRTTLVTALAENDVGRLLEDFILQGGVDTTFIRWMPYDGLGRSVRNGINFTERGYGVRGAIGVSDRGHTAASQLKKGDIDWEGIFSRGVRWFHTGGIYAALSETTPEVIEEAMRAAKKYGTIISYDLNYRPSLWENFGGLEQARKVNRTLAQYVDVMMGIGNEGDFIPSMDTEVKGVKENSSLLDIANFKRMVESFTKDFPNFKIIATTLRGVKSASNNDWGAIAWADGKFHMSTHREALEIYDRVGGGDNFASGLIYGLMEKGDLLQALEYGAAHGALAMTTPGDTSMSSLAEVEKLAKGGSARVQR